MAVLIGAALLVAQLVNFALVLNERQRLSLAQTEGPAIERFANIAADVQEADPGFQGAVMQDSSHRGARISLATASGVQDQARRRELEIQLQHALAAAGVKAGQVRAADEQAPTTTTRNAPAPEVAYIRLAAQRPDGQWLIGRMSTPKRDPWLLARLAGATAALYLIVLGAAAWLAVRLARPLRDLTGAAERFAGRTAPEVVSVRGPDDLRRAVSAFNDMNVRLAQLLDEKDRMLGALGHDLRTPLASLRLRVESMEPEAERDAAVAKIEQMSAMLEDILALARTGRARGQMKRVDVTALVEAIADDYAAEGRPVSFLESPRLVTEADAGLLRRALGNLIDNALTYAGQARVQLAAAGEHIEIRVEDEGPGVPEDALEAVLHPFQRLEASRSRETGGAGLGLAIVRSIAEGHGGGLRLENRHPKGLAAVLTLARRPAPSPSDT
jgi:signal transduction histidine kinase